MRCSRISPIANWWPPPWEPHGSLLTTREGAFRHPGFPIKLVDTVGAGDAFTAGLLHAYLRGASLPQMAEIGNLCGSYVAWQQGATPALSAELIDEHPCIAGHARATAVWGELNESSNIPGFVVGLLRDVRVAEPALARIG